MASGYSAYEVFDVASTNVAEPFLTSKLAFFSFVPSLDRKQRPLKLQNNESSYVSSTKSRHNSLVSSTIAFTETQNLAFAKVWQPLQITIGRNAVSFATTTKAPFQYTHPRFQHRKLTFSQITELLQAEVYQVKGCVVQDRSVSHSKLVVTASTFVKDIHLTNLNSDKCIIKTTGNEKLPHIKVYAPLGFNGKVLEFEQAITNIANQPFFVRYENNQLFANVCFDGEFSMFVYLTDGNIVRVTITSSIEEFLSEDLPNP